MEGRRTRRRPAWQPTRLSRLNAFLREALGRITLGRAALAVFVLPLLFYVYRETARDVLIIDPFTVPKHFEEAGLTSEVMANRIGDTLHQIEIATQTRMKKDKLASLHDEGLIPDVEIPGTKLGLRTFVDVARSVFGIYPKHISGDIVVPFGAPVKGESPLPERRATVTVYLTQGRNRSAPAIVVAAADEVETIVQRTAETVLGQVNPYVLAAYRAEHRQYEEAVEIVERIIQDPSEDSPHKQAAHVLWGNVLGEQKRYDEAIAKYQKAIEFDPKDAFPYIGWGNVLFGQRNYGQAIAKYQRASELDPKYAPSYFGWGNVLYAQKNYNEAIAKYQKAVELDPKDALPYNNWGNLLADQKKYDEATAKYKKAIDVDPKDARWYHNWASALYDQKKYDEAIARYQEAVELDPKLADAYNGWGAALDVQKRYDEAIAKYRKAIELDPNDASPYLNWGNVLHDQKKYNEAIAKYQKAIDLDPKLALAYLGWGEVLREQGKHDAADLKFKKAAELSRAQ